jgi:hypothetical protein
MQDLDRGPVPDLGGIAQGAVATRFNSCAPYLRRSGCVSLTQPAHSSRWTLSDLNSFQVKRGEEAGSAQGGRRPLSTLAEWQGAGPGTGCQKDKSREGLAYCFGPGIIGNFEEKSGSHSEFRLHPD